MTPHFETFRDAAGEYRWRYVARNGKILATSGEGYTRLADCDEAIETLLDLVDSSQARATAIVRDDTGG